MSDTPSTSIPDPVARRPVLRRVATELRAGAGLVVASLRRVAFWVAIVLPVLYPAALLHTAEALPDPGATHAAVLSAEPIATVGTLPALLALHAVTVALGHGHQPGS
jgi:uncharacterized membrane protein